MWTFTLMEKGTPKEVQTSIRRRAQFTFGPSGILEQDDMSNFAQCTQSGLSLMGKRHPQVLSMGLGHETKHDTMPGTIAGKWINEVPQRALYARWQEFMDAESWKDISIAPRTGKYEGTATFGG